MSRPVALLAVAAALALLGGGVWLSGWWREPSFVEVPFGPAVSPEFEQLMTHATTVTAFRLGGGSLAVRESDGDGGERLVVEAGDWSRDLYGRSRPAPEDERDLFDAYGVKAYPVLAEVPVTDPGLQRQLQAALRRGPYSGVFVDGRFDPGLKLCGPIVPGVGVRWVAGPKTLEMILCFQCDEAHFNVGPSWRKAYTEAARADLVRWSKQVFPSDPVIASLREVK